MKLQHEHCPGPGAATSVSVMGKRTFVQSLRRLLLPTLFLVGSVFGLLTSTDLSTARAQVTCLSTCDDIVIYDTVGNCIRFKIKNRVSNSPITRIRVESTDPGYPVAWVCSFDIDTNGTGYYAPARPGTWGQDNSATTSTKIEFVPTSPFGMGPLFVCDSGFFKLCICCPMGRNVTVPIRITAIHDDNTECFQDFNISYLGEPCGPEFWDCDEDCPELTIASSTYDPITKRSKVCVTVTNKQNGELYNFKLNIGCQGVGGTPNMWQVSSLPVGWTSSGFATPAKTTATFASASGIDNCASETFCFETDNCDIDPCENITINYVGVGYGADSGCRISVNTTLFNHPAGFDKSCCEMRDGPTVTPDGPHLNPENGGSTICFTVKRSDALSMNTITIARNAGGRKLCLTSVPWGWKLSSSTTTTDVFVIDGAANTGCRSFIFCYETCDCNTGPLPKNTTITVSGQNLSVAPLIIPFPPDQSTCCGGVARNKDHAWVTWSPTAPSCLTYHMQNTHYTCSNLNDFHFTVPFGCTISSVTVPAGFVWTYTALTNTVNVTPAPIAGGVIACCEEIAVTVCFNNCIGPFPDFNWDWTSTYNGTVITTGKERYLMGATPPPNGQSSVSSPRSESNAGEQNFPNPFGASTLFKTTIPFNANGTGVAQITIVDPTGKKILTEEMEVESEGKHFFYFTGEALPAGTYYYEIEFPKGKHVVAKRTMILVK